MSASSDPDGPGSAGRAGTHGAAARPSDPSHAGRPDAPRPTAIRGGPIESWPRRPGTRSLSWLAGVTWIGLVLAGPAHALDVSVRAYQAAAAGGRVGVVAGRAVEEARRRGHPDLPLSGFSITLVPRSAEFLARLRAVAHRGRTEPAAYSRTATALVETRREYERALAEERAAELVMYAPVSADGSFEVRDVPAGEWLLVALRPVFVARPSPDRKPKDKETFAPGGRISGYYAVAVWVREVSVLAGEETFVALTDRNTMMTAIEEKPVPSGGR